MHLYKNRELAFHHFDEDAAASEIFAARQAEREDLSFIDNASAVLSMGGGKSFSVKSRVSLSSIVTPPTAISVASSAFASAYNDRYSAASASLKPRKVTE